jgi:multiple antibiotic resistance protein
MQEFLSNILYTFIPIFVAVDIFSIVPIFISLTQGLPKLAIDKIQRESIFTAFLCGLSFLALGEFIFNVLGITEDDFKIAGGLILLVIAISDITGSTSSRQAMTRTGVVPLGVPLIVGPAVLTTLLVLVDHYGLLPTVISFVLNLLIVWVSFKGAAWFLRFLGKDGIVAVSKIMCLLLASIAIMMIRIGVLNVFKVQ